jgi:signal transduction histidine kinase
MLAVLGVTLGTFAIVVTVRYRDGLRQQARSQLLAGARAARLVSSRAQLKSLGASLALEGIDAQLSGGSGPKQSEKAEQPGAPHTRGDLLTYSERINLGGAEVTATLSSSKSSIDRAVRQLVLTELIGAIVVLLVASVLTWLATRSALAPLRHVAGVAQQIARGDRRQRLRPRRRDTELGQMAASFDAMVDSLDDAVNQATRSEAAMRRFLADASHELRTPIAALQATIETLLREQPERPQRDRLEAELARGGQRLGRLVDDLLNLARLQANEPTRTESVDLVALGDAVIADARTRASTPILLCHNGPATVTGDPDALSRALRNLIDNAIRATGDRGTVQLEIQHSFDDVKLSVSDDGPGVPAAERQRIFDGFVRLAGSSGTGTGLGLAIARAIARQHGGDVTCDDVQSGARFTLTLLSSRGD